MANALAVVGMHDVEDVVPRGEKHRKSRGGVGMVREARRKVHLRTLFPRSLVRGMPCPFGLKTPQSTDFFAHKRESSNT